MIPFLDDQTLFNAFTIPAVGLGVMYVLSRRWPKIIVEPQPLTNSIRTRDIWLAIGLWFLIFIAMYVIDQAYKLPNITFYTQLTFWQSLVKSRVAVLYQSIGWLIQIGYVVAVMRYFKLNLHDIGLNFRLKRRILFVSLLLSAQVAVTYIAMALGRLPFPITEPLPSWAWGMLAINIIDTFISAAIYEELVFRGLFYRLCQEKMPSLAAWYIQALLFSIAHVFRQPPLLATGMGMIFGFGILTTGSLIPGIVSHFLFNTTGVIGDLGETLRAVGDR